jgi:crossover junction endodeoxyribonuclease RusA
VRASTAATILATGWQQATGPVRLSAVYTLPRPPSHYRTGRFADLLRDSAPEHPASRPDLDKLLRSTLDALVDGGAIADDSRVVEVSAAKAYPCGHLDALDTPGAVLTLTPLQPQRKVTPDD